MIKTVCMSGDGNGDIAHNLASELEESGIKVYFSGRNNWAMVEADCAICTSGMIRICEPGSISIAGFENTTEANYSYPVRFIESAINLRIPHIIVFGSNSAKYGSANAIEYSATKAAIMKYVELRGALVRDMGIKLSILNFGGIDSWFWNDYRDDPLAKNIVPDPARALTVAEVVQTVIAIMRLPDNVVIKDATIVSKGYQ